MLDRDDRKNPNDHDGRQHTDQLSITGTARATVVELATGTGVAIVCASVTPVMMGRFDDRLAAQ